MGDPLRPRPHRGDPVRDRGLDRRLRRDRRPDRRRDRRPTRTGDDALANGSPRRMWSSSARSYRCSFRGRAPRVAQDPRRASAWPKRTPADGIIDWETRAPYLHDWVRAQTRPYPGAFTFLGDEKVVVWRARPVGDSRMTAPAGDGRGGEARGPCGRLRRGWPPARGDRDRRGRDHAWERGSDDPRPRDRGASRRRGARHGRDDPGSCRSRRRRAGARRDGRELGPVPGRRSRHGRARRRRHDGPRRSSGSRTTSTSHSRTCASTPSRTSR